MTTYIPRVIDVRQDEEVEIPDSARDIEIEHYTQTVEEPGIGGGSETEHWVRVKYLEKVGESVA